MPFKFQVQPPHMKEQSFGAASVASSSPLTVVLPSSSVSAVTSSVSPLKRGLIKYKTESANGRGISSSLVGIAIGGLVGLLPRVVSPPRMWSGGCGFHTPLFHTKPAFPRAARKFVRSGDGLSTELGVCIIALRWEAQSFTQMEEAGVSGRGARWD